MRDFPMFESIEEVRMIFTNFGGNSVELAYNGKEYFISNETVGCEFSIALNHQNKDPIPYNSLDELLDNYKEDGKPLREFILEMEIESIHGIGLEDILEMEREKSMLKY
ncbi:MAG: hypothetical protein LBB89_12380 [Treponema sp.]|jgi:hypothetical protein|nr:hypothetical protein [Treponema sp.]